MPQKAERESPVTSWFRTMREWHRPLAWFAAAMAGLAVVSSIGYLLDPRTLSGASIWAKPLKFSVSFFAYAVTLGWMISKLQQPRPRTLGWWSGTVLAGASMLEMTAITLQVVRGRQSHFNVSTPFDAAVYSVMGVLVFVIYLCTLVVAGVLVASPMADRAAGWAVRSGLGIGIAGLSVGFLMVVPTAAQTSDPRTSLLGAHSVDVADGGPGLPFLGWSTTGGDLRVAHFIGMHGLQLLPLLAVVLGLAPRTARLAERTRVHLVLLAAFAYAGAYALTLWQALRGQPLTAPDPVTLIAAVGLLSVVVIGAGAVAVANRRNAAGAAVTTRADPQTLSVR